MDAPIHAGQMEENMSYAIPESEVSVNAGQKRSASSALEGESPNKKAKQENDEIHEGNGYSDQHYAGNSLIQDQNASVLSNPRGYLEKGDTSSDYPEYGVSPGRKTGRMAGAKGYSLQEIQALFSFIRQKVWKDFFFSFFFFSFFFFFFSFLLPKPPSHLWIILIGFRWP